MTIGDVRLGEWPLSTDRPQQTLRAQIPAQFYGSDLVVGFEVSRLASPREMGASVDSRRIGIGLLSMTIDDRRSA